MWCCISTWLTGHKSPYVLILPRLWNVEDPNDVGGDDQALGGRLQRLMTDIEEAIKTYGRVCDLYVKKKHFAFVNVFVSLSSSPHRVIREIRRIHFANCDICHLEKKISHVRFLFISAYRGTYVCHCSRSQVLWTELRQRILQSRFICTVCIDRTLVGSLDFCTNCKNDEIPLRPTLCVAQSHSRRSRYPRLQVRSADAEGAGNVLSAENRLRGPRPK